LGRPFFGFVQSAIVSAMTRAAFSSRSPLAKVGFQK
jgi:hypothetical protein